jgi:hypothetical protein
MIKNTNNPQIVSELSNPASFKAKLWKSYFKQAKNNVPKE